MTTTCMQRLIAIVLVAGAGRVAAAAAQDFDRELERTMNLIVMIDGQIDGAGTLGAGIVVGRGDDRLYVLTANHVVRRGLSAATALRVAMRARPASPMAASLLPQFDAARDVALIAVDNVRTSGIDICALAMDRLAPVDGVKRGSDVYAIGNPNGNRWHVSVRPDQVSGVLGSDITFESPLIAGGASGGALIDAGGRILGLVQTDAPPLARAMRIEDALALAADWRYPVDLWRPLTDGQAPLHLAAHAGTPAEVTAMLRRPCANVNVRDEDRRTPLHVAAERGDPTIVAALLQAGADVKAADGSGLTALHEAAASGSVETVDRLLAAGAEVDAADRRGHTALYFGAAHATADISRRLVAAGADPNRASVDGPPLASAIEERRPAVVELLIAAGANVNARGSERSRTPLLVLAAGTGSAAVVRLLVDAGANPNSEAEWDTALTAAIPSTAASSRGRLETVRTLLSAGANPEARAIKKAVRGGGNIEIVRLLADNSMALTAEDLEAALRAANIEAARVLLDAGAPVTAKAFCDLFDTRSSYKPPQSWAQMLSVLVAAAGRNINALANRDECPLLFQSARAGETEAVGVLLAAGANPRGSASRWSPLHYAAIDGRPAVVKQLIAAHADLNDVSGGGYTPLHATLRGDGEVRYEEKDSAGKVIGTGSSSGGGRVGPDQVECIKALVQAGAKVNTVAANGDTPLHDAVRTSPAEVVRLLLDAGARIDANNDRMQTPLSIATALKRDDIVALLRARAAAAPRRGR